MNILLTTIIGVQTNSIRQMEFALASVISSFCFSGIVPSISRRRWSMGKQLVQCP